MWLHPLLPEISHDVFLSNFDLYTQRKEKREMFSIKDALAVIAVYVCCGRYYTHVYENSNSVEIITCKDARVSTDNIDYIYLESIEQTVKTHKIPGIASI